MESSSHQPEYVGKTSQKKKKQRNKTKEKQGLRLMYEAEYRTLGVQGHYFHSQCHQMQ